MMQTRFPHTTFIFTNHNQKSSLRQCDFKNCLKTYRCNCKVSPSDFNKYPKLIGQSKFAFAFSGDNAGSTRYFDAPNSGTIPIFIANQAFTNALPFLYKVPWRDFSFFLPETISDELEKEIKEILGSSEKVLRRKHEMMLKYRDELSWTRNATQVGENFLEEAWSRCISPFIQQPNIYGKR